MWPGATRARWSLDGNELFYRSENEMIAATVATEPRLGIVRRDVLFEDDYLRSTIYAQYDVDPRSGRFIMLKEQTLDLVVWLQFVEELKARVPN